MNDDLKNAIYDILVEEAGADPGEYTTLAFPHHWPECREWRFKGDLGFGGKIWARRIYGKNGEAAYHVYVTCYPEDKTSEREAIIQKTNARLAELLEGVK